MKQAHKPSEYLKLSYLAFILFTAVGPLLLMLSMSFKSNIQIAENAWMPDPIGEWKLENWSNAWAIVDRYILNSLFVSTIGTLLTVTMVIATAYVLGRYRFWGRNILYYSIIGIMFIPGTSSSLVALLDLLGDLGMMNSLWGVLVVTTATGQAAGIYILKQFIEELPSEAFEAAQMDGAGHLQQIWHVLIPLSGPMIAIVCIMDFLQSWNNTILPLIVLSDDKLLTIPAGLVRLNLEYYQDYGEIMAALLISSLPLVIAFLLSMRLFTRSLTYRGLHR